MKVPPYFERCADAVVSLERQGIGERTPGEEIARGGAFIVRTLGSAILDGTNTHIALKTSYKPRGGTFERLMIDLSVSAFLSDYAPEAIEKLPVFAAGLARSDKFEVVAVLTEDASKGKSLAVSPRPIRPGTRKYLAHALADFGTPSEIFDDDEMAHTLAFNIDGKEMFLDFEPPSFENIPRLEELYAQAIDLCEDRRFFVDVPVNSPLMREL